jgi:hypothetical protein
VRRKSCLKAHFIYCQGMKKIIFALLLLCAPVLALDLPQPQ